MDDPVPLTTRNRTINSTVNDMRDWLTMRICSASAKWREKKALHLGQLWNLDGVGSFLLPRSTGLGLKRVFLACVLSFRYTVTYNGGSSTAQGLSNSVDGIVPKQFIDKAVSSVGWLWLATSIANNSWNISDAEPWSVEPFSLRDDNDGRPCCCSSFTLLSGFIRNSTTEKKDWRKWHAEGDEWRKEIFHTKQIGEKLSYNHKINSTYKRRDIYSVWWN